MADQTNPTAGEQIRSKVKSIEEMTAYAAQLRQQGKTVALCHGVFDLLHMGHVRHLEAARAEADALFVTITADKFVNKGPGRPVFTAQLRAEMLAAMEYVEAVGVSPEPSAEYVISAIKPNAYIKGSDYKDANDDITGKILSEKEAVEAHGGRLVFTDDITFSSSTLINNHMGVFEPHVKEYLDDFKNRYALGDILSFIESLADKRVLFIGDAIIDEYLYAQPMGKAAKENIIATRFDGREVFAGGIFAAANHIADFCKEVEMITLLGEEESHESLIRGSLKKNVKPTFFYRPGAPTTRKTRFVDPGHMKKMFEVYYFDDAPVSGPLERDIMKMIEQKCEQVDVVILTDFGHGMMTPDLIEAVGNAAPFLAVNAQSNAGNLGYNLITKYDRADYICIDAPEARLAISDRFSDLEDVVTRGMRAQIDCEQIIVTHGQHGCLTYDADEGVARIPAFTRQVVDTMGAGDAFLSLTSPLVAMGVPMEVVGLIGNAVGAIKVGILGHRQSIEKVALMKYLTTLMK